MASSTSSTSAWSDTLACLCKLEGGSDRAQRKEFGDICERIKLPDSRVNLADSREPYVGELAIVLSALIL